MRDIETPMISGTYAAMAYVRFDVSSGKRDFSVLAPTVTHALEAAGLSVTVYDQSLSIAAGYEAQLPAYRMDEAIWDTLTRQGYGLVSVTPVPVRNVFSGGQFGGRRPRMYLYENDPFVFVAQGDGSDALMEKVRNFARENTASPPDIDHIVARLQEPEYKSQIWAPLMSDTRGLVGIAHFAGQGEPDIIYFADSMVAMIVGDEGLKYIPIPNADGTPRYVETWKQLTSSE